MLKIRALKKIYEDGTVGVDHLDLDIPAGEIFVLLGANGAGKTSTIMMILGFTEPTAGSVEINGIDVQKDPLGAKRHVAYVSENVILYGNFTARQNLELFARLAGRNDLKDEDFRRTIERVGMSPNALYRRVRGFSKGMRQRLGIAIAILKQAKLIVMDEPTSGLDPKGAAEFLETVQGLREEGHALLMSSHDIFRARVIADRVGIMRSGRLIEVIDRERMAEVDLQQVYMETMEAEQAGATSAELAP